MHRKYALLSRFIAFSFPANVISAFSLVFTKFFHDTVENEEMQLH